MILTTLKIQHFRNHRESYFEFGEGANILLGDNGHGKTNVLEAISYLCLTKSFYATSDLFAVAVGSDLFEVEGMFVSDGERESRVRVAYQPSSGEKVVTVNKQRIEPLSSIIGKFPIVISSPEHGPITAGGPFERRKFVDFVISQASAAYFQSLLEYRRVLKHRNKVLLDGRLSKRDVGDIIAPWDDQLVQQGSFLMARRKQFVTEFQECIVSAYRHLVGDEETPSIVYQPSVRWESGDDQQNIAGVFRENIEKERQEERRAGTTLVGPHRDEFLFTINNFELRKFASQGQHKTFLVALKIGEFYYLRDRCKETPLMLLDDIFSELDEHRAGRLLEFVSGVSQTFITSTNPHYFDQKQRAQKQDRMFYIQNGSIKANYARTA
jgi:DNA replication and repair protein RecF